MAEWKKCAWCANGFKEDDAVNYFYCSKKCYSEAYNADPEGVTAKIKEEESTNAWAAGLACILLGIAAIIFLRDWFSWFAVIGGIIAILCGIYGVFLAANGKSILEDD